MKVLLILFLIFIVWPLVKVLFTIGKARKVIRDQFRQQQARYGTNNQGGATQQPQKKKKIFGRNDGEYVEYEDIAEQPSTQEQISENKDTSVSSEPQIEDAEWEEIK